MSAIYNKLLLALTKDSKPLLPATQEWIERVEHALAAKPMSKMELARRVGCSRSSITMLLNGTQEVSRIVVPVSEVLGITLPTDPRTSSKIEELAHEAAESLSDDDLALAEAFLQRLLSNKPSNSND